MNVINLVGNLTADVELKHSQGGTAYTSFNIGVQRAFKDKQSGEYKSDFPRCKAFGKTAEIIAEHFGKGSKIGLTGSVQTDRYEKDGQTVYTTDIMVDRVHFVAPKAQNQGVQQQNNAEQGGYEQNPYAGLPNTATTGNITVDKDDFGGELPFLEVIKCKVNLSTSEIRTAASMLSSVVYN